jgi:flagellar hook protein FlgE
MAGFNTSVTGLKAAQTELDVTGNNIANASTVG